jgi:hypothetical protein
VDGGGRRWSGVAEGPRSLCKAVCANRYMVWSVVVTNDQLISSEGATYAFLSLHSAEQYSAPKHRVQISAGNPLSMVFLSSSKSLSHTTQVLCSCKALSRDLHDALCDLLDAELVCLAYLNGRADSDVQIGLLAYIAAVGCRLAQLACYTIAVLPANSALVVACRL